MQITNHIHALKIPFKVPVSQDVTLDRFAYVYLVFGDKIHLIDSGVAGSETAILAYISGLGKGLEDLTRIHAAVRNNSTPSSRQDTMDLCRKVVRELGLPPLAVMPLVANALASSVAAESI